MRSSGDTLYGILDISSSLYSNTQDLCTVVAIKPWRSWSSCSSGVHTVPRKLLHPHSSLRFLLYFRHSVYNLAITEPKAEVVLLSSFTSLLKC